MSAKSSEEQIKQEIQEITKVFNGIFLTLTKDWSDESQRSVAKCVSNILFYEGYNIGRRMERERLICSGCGQLREDDCKCSTLSPCCGVEFDEDIRICPECKEHV
jgi:adenine C2-methylase RlmN of 23S rRNA A2503 and tRNA A37